MSPNDRCRREVTSEGVTAIVCDMHRDGGPDAVGEKCPYYCDRVDCRRAGEYEVEGGLYCAPCARLTLGQALEKGETIEVEYHTISVTEQLAEALDNIERMKVRYDEICAELKKVEAECDDWKRQRVDVGLKFDLFRANLAHPPGNNPPSWRPTTSGLSSVTDHAFVRAGLGDGCKYVGPTFVFCDRLEDEHTRQSGR